MIPAIGPIQATPFGTAGDLILVPDPGTEAHVDFGDGSPPEHFFLGDLRNTDGSPWECCPREFLRRALAALHDAAGVSLHAAFEHEFTYGGVEDLPGAAFTLDALRRQGNFGGVLMAAMRAAGVVPDSFLPEYGPRQFEVTCAPATGIRAADHAVVLREMVRATAHRLGHRASFTPIMDRESVGNGVHIHMSLRDADGQPAMHDPQGKLGLSTIGQNFVAGILVHLPALCAATAPSTISYIRMRPNRWAPTHATLVDRDRGASLRVCPILSLPGADAATQFNVEYRPADAAASPYLALGAIVWAGVDGIRRKLDLPDGDGAPLPTSLGAALDALEATPQATEWFGATYLSAYLMFKRSEFASLGALVETEQCERYARAY
jgi:glutamine synthetase